MDTVRLMIRWLSEHFRYVFQNQENLVTVREELKEGAYCHIYMVRGEMPILVRKNVADGLLRAHIGYPVFWGLRIFSSKLQIQLSCKSRLGGIRKQ